MVGEHSELCDADGFEPCPSGEFARLAQRLRARRNRRTLLCSLGAAAACTGAGALLWHWLSAVNTSDPAIAGIRCSQVRARAAAYVRGELAAEEQRQFALHLAECERCRRFVRAMGERT